MEEEITPQKKKFSYLPIIRCSKEYKEKIRQFYKSNNMTYASMLRHALFNTYGIKDE